MHKVRLARIQAGLSQDELAEKAKVSQHTISEVELGRRSPQGKTLRKLAAALGVSIPDLIGEVEQDPKVVAPPSLAEWLEERCGHAYLAMPRGEFEEMFDRLPEDSSERRELALKINREYNTFCKFPSNVTTTERVAMRRMIRDAITDVAVKHGIALMEGELDREYQEEVALIIEVERATERDTA